MKYIKSFPMIAAMVFFSVSLLAGCVKKAAQSDSTAESTTIISEENSGEMVLNKSDAEQVCYFAEVPNLPTPSSLYPESFSENEREESDDIIYYFYDIPAGNAQEITDLYVKYIRSLLERGFETTAADEVYPAAFFLTYNGECVGIIGPAKEGDPEKIIFAVILGDGIKQIYERFHKTEQAADESNMTGSLSLSQGNYSVPKDISAGTYDIKIGSSKQHAVSSIYYYKNGKLEGCYAINSERGYHALTLESGDSIEISGDSVILIRSN